jgi:hypothetical protein
VNSYYQTLDFDDLRMVKKTYKITIKLKEDFIFTKNAVKMCTKFVFIHHNSKHLHYLREFYTFESFPLHVIHI